ncbi:hypothetical protein [Streptomyces sp. NPDC007100]|uniref:hypothetical protein n=1 Tax=Streptomyces sp. NPDC007100 TaxID=3155602 RepID=UPI0033F09A42
MITSTPLARWTWGDEVAGDDWVTASAEAAGAALSVLAGHRLVVGEVLIRVSVSEAGNPESILYQHVFSVNSATLDAEMPRFVSAISEGVAPGRVGNVSVDATCPGMVLGDGAEHREERLFLLGVSVAIDFLSIRLATFSDAWMPFDLRGREQRFAHEANSPRLAAALKGISDIVGDEVEPDDPTWFGSPNETGVANHFDPDGSASDVWATFEVPYRNRVFHHRSQFGHDGYRRSTDGAVHFVPVGDGRGVLGYLWASDEGAAASYEPRDSSGEAGYRAGLSWVELLRQAEERGILPSEALTELVRVPGDELMGHALTDKLVPIAGLASLREMASRE